MKASDFIVEFSEFHEDEIKSHMEKLGYKFLGQGVDQMAFEDPHYPNQVLKIFGYDWQGEGGMSEDQKMVYVWAKFCEDQPKNPYLPKFFGIETFIFRGMHYLQFRQEKLFKNRFFGESITQSLVNAVEADYTFEQWVRNKNAGHENGFGKERTVQAVLNDPKQVRQLKGFYDTVKALYNISEQKDWMFDLHEGNILMRADTTPVIVDPWVL